MSAPTRALVVDDSDDQAQLLRKYLSKAGCRVQIASNAEDAMVAYAADPPQLAVIDLMLPGVDGWTLARALKSAVPDCRIVITSVLEPSDYPEADGMLPKPFTGAQVRALLADLLPESSSS